jgi:hypothetical protein
MVLYYNAIKSHVCTAVKSSIKKTWEKAIKGKQWLEAVTRQVKWRNRQTETEHSLDLKPVMTC